MGDYAWLATEMRTGEIIADLPNLKVESIKEQIATYQTTTAVLPLVKAPENWLRATMPGATVYNLVDMTTSVPVWGGYITRRPRSLSDELSLSLATIPAYFDRRFVGDRPYTDVGQNAIVTDLVNTYAALGSNGGIPIRVQLVTAGAGKLRTRTDYKDISDKTLYSVLTELYGVDGGPEWTVGWEWQHNPERITPVLYVGDRLGSPVTPGLAPNATFEAPSPAVVGAELTEDYSAANSGNDFMATSTASGDERPQSDHVLVADMDRPTFERRWTPSTSITDVDTLNEHAQSMADLQSGGQNTLELQALVRDGVRLGKDWSIGDDIGYAIGGLIADRRTKVVPDAFVDTFTDRFGATSRVLVNPFGKDSVPAFPGGTSGVVRAIGWQLDFGEQDTVTPILQGADVDGI